MRCLRLAARFRASAELRSRSGPDWISASGTMITRWIPAPISSTRKLNRHSAMLPARLITRRDVIRPYPSAYGHRVGDGGALAPRSLPGSERGTDRTGSCARVITVPVSASAGPGFRFSEDHRPRRSRSFSTTLCRRVRSRSSSCSRRIRSRSDVESTRPGT